MNNKWTVLSGDEDRTEEIKNKFNLNWIVARVLANKNLSDKEIEVFLNPKRQDFYDPFLMPDMKKAVDRIIKAIDQNEKIIIYGDYDVDGITSTVILKRFFKDRGIEVGTYIPNRLFEGYGLNEEAIKEISKQGYSLMITVDTGITAIEEVENAKKYNIDVIITDHHEQADSLPKAVAVVDCKRKDSKYPFSQLAGCGVAFKLTKALSMALEINENECLKYLDLACIGTISDIVPLEDENRLIAKLGLLLVKQTKNIGLRELIKRTGCKEVNSEAISFGISPRINACGRMGYQEVALKLFLTEDPIEARDCAEQVEIFNRKRQDIEKEIYEDAIRIISQEAGIKDIDNINPEDIKEKSIVVANNGWHNGVIGIVSSKITDKFYRPCILIGFDGENAKGSGRSIEGFDLHKAILDCGKYLDKCGGHNMAIGLSLKRKNFDSFKKEFVEYSNKIIKDECLVKEIIIDEEITKKDITIEGIKQIELLAPFGEGNKEPVILYKNLKINSIRGLSEGKHIKLDLQDENINIQAIGFNMGNIANTYQIGDHIDVIGNININVYNNYENIQIVIKDIRKTIK